MTRTRLSLTTTPPTDTALFGPGLAMLCAPVWSVGSCHPLNAKLERYSHVCVPTPAAHAVQAASGQPAQPVAEDNHPENPAGELRAHRFGRTVRIAEDDMASFTAARRR